MRLGILDTVGLAASLIFALPVGVYGAERLLGGDAFLGGVLVAVAALMVLLPRRLTTPGDLPAAAAEKVVGAAVADREESDREE